MEKTLQELSELVSAKLIGNPDHRISGVETLELATENEASFLGNDLYRPLLQTTQAGVICIDEKTLPIEGRNFLVSPHPSITFQALIKLFLQQQIIPSAFTQIHPSAVIHSSVKLGEGVTVGPNAVIDQACVIGEKTNIGPCVSIGPGVTIGSYSRIYPNVTIREGCQIGNRVIIQSGASIGSCGFGYKTNEKGEHIKEEQLGIVILEDDVEIGANTTINRARFKATRISKGSKLDNLVQVGHNTILGPYNLIVSQTGISGSVTTGKYVIMGGQTGTVGHVKIASGAMFAARSGIKKSILKAGKYGGNPAIALSEHNREQVYLKKIATLAKQIKELENKIGLIK